MRPVASRAALALLLAAAPARAGSPLARLAQALADQIAGVAKGRSVELAPPEDRTGRGAALGLDLRALVAARLEGRVAVDDAGPRLRIVSVLSETPRRIVVSARVVEEPGGRLVDLLSASVETDETLLGLSPERLPTAPRTIDVLASNRTPPLDAQVLDLAFVGDERIAVLTADALALYRWDDSGVVQESRQALPGPLATVRAPAGIIAAAPHDDALWVLTNRAPRAVLFAVDGKRLVRRTDAAALPWPGCPGGLRYRPGTNLIEGVLSGLGPGPFLALASAEADLAVTPEGELRLASAGGAASGPLRAGPTLAPLWRGLVAASSPNPPGSDDAVLLLAREDSGLRLRDTLRVEGAVRALAGRVHGETARLVAAVEEPAGGTYLLLMDLRRREP